MKKFKFFSKLLAVLVIVPAILLCTACGGGQLAQEAKLEQKEFTQLTSAAEFQTKMAEIEETQITDGYHMTFNMKMNMPLLGMNFEKFNMNMYYVPGETAEETKIAAKYDMKMDMNMDLGFGDPIEMSTEANGTMYVTDGYAYTDVKGTATANGQTEDMTEKTKVPFVLGAGEGPIGMAEAFADLEQIFGMFYFEDMQDIEGVKFFVSTDGTQLKMTLDAFEEVGEEDGIKVNKYEMVFQFAEGRLTGMAIDVNMELTSGGETIPMEMKITVAPFAGEIDMPANFDGYKEPEELGLGF